MDINNILMLEINVGRSEYILVTISVVPKLGYRNMNSFAL